MFRLPAAGISPHPLKKFLWGSENSEIREDRLYKKKNNLETQTKMKKILIRYLKKKYIRQNTLKVKSEVNANNFLGEFKI